MSLLYWMLNICNEQSTKRRYKNERSKKRKEKMHVKREADALILTTHHTFFFREAMIKVKGKNIPPSLNKN